MRPGTYNEQFKYWELSIPWQEYYSVQTASRILGMGTTQIYSCINRETMEAWRVGNVVRITHDELLAYIERRGSHSVSLTEDTVIERVIPKTPRGNRAQGKIQGAPSKVGTVTAAISRGKVAAGLAEALGAQPQNIPISDPLPEHGQGQPTPEQVPVGGLDLDALNLGDEEATDPRPPPESGLPQSAPADGG